LRGELAATSFGGEVYLAALFFACLAAHSRPPHHSPYHTYGFGFGGLRLHPPYGQKNWGLPFPVSEMGGQGSRFALAEWEGRVQNPAREQFGRLARLAALAGGGGPRLAEGSGDGRMAIGGMGGPGFLFRVGEMGGCQGSYFALAKWEGRRCANVTPWSFLGLSRTPPSK
jgi:hypothetical protein